MASSSGLIVQTIQGVTSVTFNETAVLDAAVIDAIGRDLYALVDKQDRRRIVLDMSKIEFLSSMMIGVVINLYHKVTKLKGQLAICGLRPKLMQVFTITRLDKLLKFYPDENAALAAFNVYMR
jgi:anti-sigma B factor antagonist